ncbi:MAG: response regulator transcription factor, partial [Chryseobacterium sp.]
MDTRFELSNELNCIIIDDEPHALVELEELIEQVPGIRLEHSFSNARDAITYLHGSGKIDVIFSDINMPSVSGIDAANVLQSYCDFLVFVTAYRDYALEAIKAKVYGYLMKPLRYVDFVNQVIEIRAQVEESTIEVDDFIFLKGDHKNNYFKVMCHDIIYIKGMLNYVQVITAKEKHITYSLLGDIERELS